MVVSSNSMGQTPGDPPQPGLVGFRFRRPAVVEKAAPDGAALVAHEVVEPLRDEA